MSLVESPLVSVVIPAYNAENYIAKAINSALNQSYPNIEIIVVNDGSTDNTENVLAQFTNNGSVRIVSQSNHGMSGARNTGIRNVRGEFIAFLDSDDYWEPQKIEKQVDLLQQHLEIGFCSTQTRVETPDGEFINLWSCPSLITSTLCTIFSQNSAIAGSASSVLARMTLQNQVGFFDETLQGLEDTDMWIRYATKAEYCCIPETLTIVLKRSNSVSRNLDNMFKSAIRMYKKNRLLLENSLQKRFWRSAYACMLCDFAKWEARQGRKLAAMSHILLALFISPFNQGRLCISLIFAIVTNQKF